MTPIGAFLLAQGSTNPRGPEFGEASPWGLVIILILLAVTVLLVRSMNGHITNLADSFEPDSDDVTSANSVDNQDVSTGDTAGADTQR